MLKLEAAEKSSSNILVVLNLIYYSINPILLVIYTGLYSGSAWSINRLRSQHEVRGIANTSGKVC